MLRGNLHYHLSLLTISREFIHFYLHTYVLCPRQETRAEKSRERCRAGELGWCWLPRCRAEELELEGSLRLVREIGGIESVKTYRD